MTRKRSSVGSVALHGHGYTNNVLEHRRMILAANAMIGLPVHTPVAKNDRVFLMRDSNSAVHWVDRCRGGADAPIGHARGYWVLAISC